MTIQCRLASAMQLEDRGHAAMADRYRIGAEIDGGEAVSTANGLLYAARSDFPVLTNGALLLGEGDAVELLADAREFFGDRQRGFTLLARSDPEAAAAEAAGMHLLIERYPAMVRHERFAERVVAGAELRRVSDERDARVYAAVADAAFPAIGMPPGLLADLPAEGFLRDDSAGFVAYEGDRPLACASVVVARGIAGIQWVAVIDEARGRGLADACTRAASNAGFEMGADCAWLEASHMGEPVYLRMGFEEVFNYRMYVAPAPG
jgi:ribosomal protein S18 acetylase RimI-like enzyme